MSNKGVGPQRFLDQNHLDSFNKLSILETHLRPIKSELPGVEPGLVFFKKLSRQSSGQTRLRTKRPDDL